MSLSYLRTAQISRAIRFQMDQLVLALPSREYYLKPSSKTDLNAYYNYMVQIAILLGAEVDTAQKDMAEALDFEIMLANV